MDDIAHVIGRLVVLIVMVGFMYIAASEIINKHRLKRFIDCVKVEQLSVEDCKEAIGLAK